MLITSSASLKISTNKSLWLPMIAFLACLNSYTQSLSYIFIAGYALLGKEEAIQALVLSWFFAAINPAISPVLDNQALFRFLIIFSAFTSIFFRTSFLKFDLLSIFTLSLSALIIIHSIFFSYHKDVSILKTLSWTIVMLTLLKAWSGLNVLEHRRMQKWIVRLLLLIALLSVPTLFIQEIGFARNNYGFQGILAHPQIFGPTIAMLAAIIFGQLFEKNNKSSIFLIILVLFCGWLIFLSKARTAGLGLFLALATSLLIFFILNLFKKKLLLSIFKSRSVFYISIIIIIFILFGSETSQLISKFITKSESDVSGIYDAYKLSRFILFEKILINIDKNFMTGIGFGIASDPSTMFVQRDPIFNIPISASTEKGMVFLMMLEEVGIFIFIFFIMWLSYIFFKAFKNGLKGLIFFFTIIFLNFGESTFFSMGGLGLLSNILLISVITEPKLQKNLSMEVNLRN